QRGQSQRSGDPQDSSQGPPGGRAQDDDIFRCAEENAERFSPPAFTGAPTAAAFDQTNADNRKLAAVLQRSERRRAGPLREEGVKNEPFLFEHDELFPAALS